MGLAGKVIVVTGAGSGIGRAIAEQLIQAGTRVTVVGRRELPLCELVEGAQDSVLALPIDVTAPGAPNRIVTATVHCFGRLDAVVNNAGLARFARLVDADPDDFQAMLDVNLRAPAELIKAALPHLQRSRGAVVNVSSVGGTLAMPGRAFYGASKAALNSLTRSLARELAPDIRVNAVLPGPVDTPMYGNLGLTGKETARLRGDLIAGTPMQRFGDTGEVAQWVCCLLDDEISRWVTGALIPIDGGRTA